MVVVQVYVLDRYSGISNVAQNREKDGLPTDPREFLPRESKREQIVRSIVATVPRRTSNAFTASRSLGAGTALQEAYLNGS
jgi:hypothetical protein